jgi:hypothetical protein
LVESLKWVVLRPSNEGPRPKSGKLRLNLHGTSFGGQIPKDKSNPLLKLAKFQPKFLYKKMNNEVIMEVFNGQK